MKIKTNAERLAAMTVPEPNSGCLLWTGAASGSGYGHFVLDGKVINAHRAAWIIANGPIEPTALDICHRCDVRLCVNVDHLFLGTEKENVADAVRKGRMHSPRTDALKARSNCHAGHEYTENNTRIRGGTRWCRACDNARRRRYRMEAES